MARFADYRVEVGGLQLPAGSCVIHFYYSPTEQTRFASFLAEGVQRGEASLLAQVAPAPALESAMAAMPRGNHLSRLQLSPPPQAAAAEICREARRLAQRAPVRLLVDFGCSVPQDAILEVEAALYSGLASLPVVAVSQYDGSAVAAQVLLEQFKTHALAIVGNAFYKENQKFTSPSLYLSKRAGASSGG